MYHTTHERTHTRTQPSQNEPSWIANETKFGIKTRQRWQPEQHLKRSCEAAGLKHGRGDLRGVGVWRGAGFRRKVWGTKMCVSLREGREIGVKRGAGFGVMRGRNVEEVHEGFRGWGGGGGWGGFRDSGLEIVVTDHKILSRSCSKVQCRGQVWNVPSRRMQVNES